MFDTGLVDYGVQPWDTDDPGWIDQIVAADPGDDRPAHLLAALAPVDEEPAPRPVAEILTDAESGPVSPAGFTDLTRLDPEGLSDDEQVAVMIAWQRYEAHCAGMKLRAVAYFAGRP
jgi:hypothetical protein